MEKISLLEEKKEKKNKNIIIWRVLSIFFFILFMTILVLYILGVGWKENKNKDEKNNSPEKLLSLWNPNSESRKKLINYVTTITDKSNPKYIPPESRIAVFDFDGTLFCETDTVYFESLLYSYRVLNDSNYKDKACKNDIQTAIDIMNVDIRNFTTELEMRYVTTLPKIFENMTYEDFDKYIKNYMKIPSIGYTKMTRGEAFYDPMVQVIEYLEANDFIIYIVTGSDRHIVRTVSKSRLNIPERQIIGTISTVAASGQVNRSNFDYEYKDNDELILGGEFKLENVKMNKVSLIKTEIGIKPILCFGNSSGDYSMAKYITSNNKYESMAFMVCCDDLERENGSIEKAKDVKDKCEKNKNWVPISMKNDWKRIYAEGVVKKS
jgi:phosphoglycolate phosphatase-like HAD superfamily hydrolase